MNVNMGSRDQTTRVFIALLLGAMILFGMVDGILAVVLGCVALLLLGTSAFRRCPLYVPFGFSSVEDGAFTHHK